MEWNNGKLAEQLIVQAQEYGASDVHIEPYEHDAHIRFRMDGLLQEICVLPRPAYQQLLTQLKVAGGLDIAEKRLPQDGRLAFTTPSGNLDVRLSTLPTINGEKAALRLLGRREGQLALEELDFTSANLEAYTSACHAAHGIILVTGPTGSGKTTTLYSTLSILDHTQQNIITVEDPVEYKLNGINQVAVNRKAGLDFATGLRSILRQDPDVIMVGEIRDQETAEIALRAALTGHLVFSTLHTNSAMSAVVRLLNMGMEPYLVASTLRCVLAQRLVRRICPQCSGQYEASSVEKFFLGHGAQEELWLRRGQGCSHCHGTGYSGRIALQEVLRVDEDFSRLLAKCTDETQLAAHRREQGGFSLFEDGMTKVKAGLTTVQELWRVGVGSR